jgi:hypothetical protein
MMWPKAVVERSQVRPNVSTISSCGVPLASDLPWILQPQMQMMLAAIMTNACEALTTGTKNHQIFQTVGTLGAHVKVGESDGESGVQEAQGDERGRTFAGEKAGIGRERPAASRVVVSMEATGSTIMEGAVAARGTVPRAAAGRTVGVAVNAEAAAMRANRRLTRSCIDEIYAKFI